MLRGRAGSVYGPVLIVGLALPFFAVLGVGFLFPLVKGLITSLSPEGQFAEPYLALTRDPVYWKILARTILTAGLVSLISAAIAYPTAEFIARVPPRLRPLLLALIIVPLWSSVVARTYGWYGVFVSNGVADWIAGLLGQDRLMLLYSPTAVIAGMVHVLLPIVLIPLYVAVRRYDERLSAASLSLGASRFRTLILVKLPVLAPTIIGATMVVFVIALGFYITPALLGGPDSYLVSNLISQQVLQRFDLPRGLAMSMVLLATTIFVLAIAGAAIALLRRTVR